MRGYVRDRWYVNPDGMRVRRGCGTDHPTTSIFPPGALTGILEPRRPAPHGVSGGYLVPRGSSVGAGGRDVCLAPVTHPQAGTGEAP
jgi:hypothetical protein